MAAKQASTKRASLMHAHFVLEPFYNRRDEQGLKSSVELKKLSPLATQTNRCWWISTQTDANGELRMCGDSKTMSGPKPKQLAT